ncbi:Protein kinase-like domain [Pseudocohnilembus persalinus]|uniref:non-specific serine/threonine protein kinase n=1 Tax=Pseudocohnilembus persalinus TaxID=266149 RepID=A0A0V0QK68_PSEPJ|nr:Protein kinase-like domain [Pseudocohnilembus persalinus]|eukprot:KRX02432.1 Protein kinase-like domain [Pseudocohnilembus persalinus]
MTVFTRYIHFLTQFLKSENIIQKGGDLAQRIKAESNKKRLFPEKQILDWFTKIVHRDLKGQNIFITKENRIKLGDFGIARQLKQTLEKCKTMVGTPYYLSPEIIENQPYSFQSDIWSLGIILYEMCTQKPPFTAESLQQLALRIVRGEYLDINSKYSLGLRQLIKQMLNLNPQKRPTINQILGCDVIVNRIKEFLSETQKQQEFDHTIIHDQKMLHDSQIDMSDIITVNNEKPMPSHLLKIHQQQKLDEIKKKHHLLQLEQIKEKPQFEKDKIKNNQKETHHQPKLPLINQQPYIPDQISNRNLYTPQTKGLIKKQGENQRYPFQHNNNHNNNHNYFVNNKFNYNEEKIEKYEKYKIKKINNISHQKPMTPSANKQNIPSFNKLDHQRVQTPGNNNSNQKVTQNSNFSNYSKASNQSNQQNLLRQNSQPNILKKHEQHRRQSTGYRVQHQPQKRSVSRGKQQKSSRSQSNNSQGSQRKQVNQVNQSKSKSRSRSKSKRDLNSGSNSRQNNKIGAGGVLLPNRAQDKLNEIKKKNSENARKKLESAPSSQFQKFSNQQQNQNCQKQQSECSQEKQRLHHDILQKKKQKEDERQKLREQMIKDIENNRMKTENDILNENKFDRTKEKQYQFKPQIYKNQKIQNKSETTISTHAEDNHGQQQTPQNKNIEIQFQYEFDSQNKQVSQQKQNDESGYKQEFPGFQNQNKNKKNENYYQYLHEQKELHKISASMPTDQIKPIRNQNQIKEADHVNYNNNQKNNSNNIANNSNHNFKINSNSNLQPFGLARPKTSNRKKIESTNFNNHNNINENNINKPVKPQLLLNNRLNTPNSQQTISSQDEQQSSQKQQQENQAEQIIQQKQIQQHKNQHQNQNYKHQKIYDADHNIEELKQVQQQALKIFNYEDLNELQFIVNNAANKVDNIPEIPFFDNNKNYFNLNSTQIENANVMLTVQSNQETLKIQKNKQDSQQENSEQTKPHQYSEENNQITKKNHKKSSNDSLYDNSQLEGSAENLDFQFNPNYTRVSEIERNQQNENILQSHGQYYYDNEDEEDELEVEDDEVDDEEIQEKYIEQINEKVYQLQQNQQNKLSSQQQQNEQNQKSGQVYHQCYDTLTDMTQEQEQIMRNLDENYIQMKDIKNMIIGTIGQDNYDKSYKVLQKEIQSNHDIQQINQKHGKDNYKNLLPFLTEIQRRELISMFLAVVMTEEQMA